VPTTSSVWYSLRLPAKHRGSGSTWPPPARWTPPIDVYHAVRSQLISVGCQQTEAQGKASITFAAAKNGLYEIRVAALQDSQLAPFSLEVFLPTPAVQPPGPPLPAAGVSGQVDRIQDINAAYSITMRAGVSYMISLANETRKGACVSGALFAPGTGSFGGEEEEAGGDGALLSIHCGGFRLFTPGAGQGGRYSFEITPRFSTAACSASTCRSRPSAPTRPRPGSRLETTPTHTDTSMDAACRCCACIAWKSRATPTSRSRSARPNRRNSSCSCATRAATVAILYEVI
jgi:hypothetical protein